MASFVWQIVVAFVNRIWSDDQLIGLALIGVTTQKAANELVFHVDLGR